jgi:GPH family glycoside/pentoside/hexuronide:cation symporter
VTAALAQRDGLGRWALFGAMLASVGLPVYINAPKFYVDEYGVGLAALGAVLAGLRLFDVVQDPVLGWLAERGRARRGLWVAVAGGVMAVSMIGLFAVAPPVAPLLWFALTLIGLFTAFSYLNIVFYAEGVAKAATLGAGGHLRLAGWREGGALAGITVATVAPVLLGGFGVFAALFVALVVLALFAMTGQWGREAVQAAGEVWASFRPALADAAARRLLILSFVNSVPVAITSTLFLFFVESRLDAPGREGPLLLLFFVAAGISTPVWSRLAKRYGARRVLLGGMVLAVVSFLWAARLGSGDVAAFAVICAASGAALGADMVLLPAMFARRLDQMDQGGEAAGFGLWNFASKLSLAFAAATLLPTLQAVGFQAGSANTPQALGWLSGLYALLPCGLKLLAIGLLLVSPNTEE